MSILVQFWFCTTQILQHLPLVFFDFCFISTDQPPTPPGYANTDSSLPAENNTSVSLHIDILDSPSFIQGESYRSCMHLHNHIHEQMLRYVDNGMCIVNTMLYLGLYFFCFFFFAIVGDFKHQKVDLFSCVSAVLRFVCHVHHFLLFFSLSCFQSCCCIPCSSLWAILTSRLVSAF